MSEIVPYGAWPSPISPVSVSENIRLGDVKWDTDGKAIVWLEGRSGQGVLLTKRFPDGSVRELTDDVSVRAEIGYGGGDFTVARGYVYYVTKGCGRIYKQSLKGGKAEPVTPDFGRAASMTISPCGRFLMYVHHDDGEDRLAIVGTTGNQWPKILAEGCDFYMQPRWSGDGRRVAWVSWNHPNMPWDGSRLHVAEVSYDTAVLPIVGEVRCVAGGDDISVFQPEFTEDCRSLIYISDETGMGQLWCHSLESGDNRQITSRPVEHGQPAWMQDMRSFGLLPGGALAAVACNDRGFVRLHQVDLSSGEARSVEAAAHFTELAQLSINPCLPVVAFVGSCSTLCPRVATIDLASNHEDVVARASLEELPTDALSVPEVVEWPTESGRSAYGLFYPPSSERRGSSELPPLVVLVHGGPTSQETARFNIQAQFFATRGYAVLCVNYRGSTGFGRAYMLELRGSWGVFDVRDAVGGVRYLVDRGRVNRDKCAIMGGSAGGYTVLQTMITEPEVFAAGVSYYGVTDLLGLVNGTHKFEAHYMRFLVGRLPEASEVYRERSPVFQADKITRPLAIFQGEDDKVVPIAQAEAIVAALKAGRVEHEYRVYTGEGHGFRQRETIEDFYAAVESFLNKHLVCA